MEGTGLSYGRARKDEIEVNYGLNILLAKGNNSLTQEVKFLMGTSFFFYLFIVES